MGEYYKATDNKEAAKIAAETYENVKSRLSKPGSYKIAPYSIPEGMKTSWDKYDFSFFSIILARY